MVFSSLVFLFAYLPAVLLVYYLSPLRWRNAVLFAVNLLFYGWGEPVYILLMIPKLRLQRPWSCRAPCILSPEIS